MSAVDANQQTINQADQQQQIISNKSDISSQFDLRQCIRSKRDNFRVNIRRQITDDSFRQQREKLEKMRAFDQVGALKQSPQVGAAAVTVTEIHTSGSSSSNESYAPNLSTNSTLFPQYLCKDSVKLQEYLAEFASDFSALVREQCQAIAQENKQQVEIETRQDIYKE